MRVKQFLLLILTLSMPALSFASGWDVSENLKIIDTFTDRMPEIIGRAVNTPAYNSLVFVLMTAFGLFALVFAIRDYILDASNVSNVLSAVIAVGITWVFVGMYSILVGVFLEFQTDFSAMLQLGLLGNSDPLYPLYYLFEVYDRVEIYNPAPDSVMGAIMWFFASIGYIFISLAFQLINVIMFLVQVVAGLWSIWGFAVLALVGKAMFPFLLFERMSFLFDGWLRVMLTVTFFAVMSKISTSLSVIGFSLLLGIPDLRSMEGEVWVMASGDGTNLLALAVWGLMSIYGIKASYTFATGLVSGMSTGIASGGSLQKSLSRLSTK